MVIPRLLLTGAIAARAMTEWVAIAVENDGQWKRFCNAVGKPSWTSEARFADGPSRRKNQESLDTLIEAWTSTYDHHEVMEIMQTAGVPAGAVLNMKEMHLDPHLRERGFFEVVDHGGSVGKRPIPTQLPAKFSNVETFASKRAPHFGEDNAYVYHELLGMSEEELKDLEKKVIGGIPSFPPARPTRKDLIETQGSGRFDPDYLRDLKKAFGEIG